MKHIHIRKLNGHDMEEVKACETALFASKDFDAKVVSYPATTVLVAEDGKPRAFMPIQKCFVMESLGIAEGSGDLVQAAAMKQIVSILVWESREAGQGEFYFMGNNEATNQFALNNGFEEVPFKMFRMRTL